MITFEKMNLDEKIMHIEKCRLNALECIKNGEPSCLADIADQVDIWMPWALNAVFIYKTALEQIVSLKKVLNKNDEKSKGLEVAAFIAERTLERHYE